MENMCVPTAGVDTRIRTLDAGVEEVTGALTPKEIITLIETLRLARDVKIKRLEDYIQYRERRHYNDECEIAELKDYLAVCIDNLAENK